MYTLSENLPRKEMQAFDGMGTVISKILTDKDGLYGHGRLFNHSVINPGCSIGYHVHNNETEFYYILKGEAVFNDDGKEVILHAGDIGITVLSTPMTSYQASGELYTKGLAPTNVKT
jgi:mannose-6-phosphate isomerase-like protein (cupin superfamily)